MSEVKESAESRARRAEAMLSAAEAVKDGGASAQIGGFVIRACDTYGNPLGSATEGLELARDAAEQRFFTAQEKREPRDLNGLAAPERVAILKEAVVTLATLVEAYVPGGRNKALALTALEDVQMRANRGIFAHEGE